MIKLKLTRDQLLSLCAFTSPARFEEQAIGLIASQDFTLADYVFNLVQVGEKAAKMYLFNNKDKYSVKLTLSEAASLLILFQGLDGQFSGNYNNHVAELIKVNLHGQLTNYQPRYNHKQVTIKI